MDLFLVTPGNLNWVLLNLRLWLRFWLEEVHLIALWEIGVIFNYLVFGGDIGSFRCFLGYLILVVLGLLIILWWNFRVSRELLLLLDWLNLCLGGRVNLEVAEWHIIWHSNHFRCQFRSWNILNLGWVNHITEPIVVLNIHLLSLLLYKTSWVFVIFSVDLGYRLLVIVNDWSGVTINALFGLERRVLVIGRLSNFNRFVILQLFFLSSPVQVPLIGRWISIISLISDHRTSAWILLLDLLNWLHEVLSFGLIRVFLVCSLATVAQHIILLIRIKFDNLLVWLLIQLRWRIRRLLIFRGKLLWNISLAWDSFTVIICAVLDGLAIDFGKRDLIWFF